MDNSDTRITITLGPLLRPAVEASASLGYNKVQELLREALRDKLRALQQDFGKKEKEHEGDP